MPVHGLSALLSICADAARMHTYNRYKFWGDVCTKAATALAEPETEAFFAKLIQRVAPKSDVQCFGEVATTRKWLEYIGGDQTRMLARSFAIPGDHDGQETRGYRFPYVQYLMAIHVHASSF